MEIIYFAASQQRGLRPISVKSLVPQALIIDDTGFVHGRLLEYYECAENPGHYVIKTVDGDIFPAWSQDIYDDFIRKNSCHC